MFLRTVSKQIEENPVSALKNFDAMWEDALQCRIRKVAPNTLEAVFLVSSVSA